jgi:acyl-CoA synthetase (NDP forming)/GNAT superfamily N-acetyltransferase
MSVPGPEQGIAPGTPGPGGEHAGPRSRGLSQGPLDQGVLLLRNGMAVEVRRLVPADSRLLEDFLGRLSPDTLERRFLGAVAPEVAARDLLHDLSRGERFALVIVLGGPSSPRIVAHGEYVQDGPGSESAEIAFLVEEDLQGMGIGSALLERLTLLAVRRGVRRFWARTSRENRPMLEVFRSMGFALTESASGGEVEVHLPLGDSPGFLERYEFREKVATVASLVPFFEPRGVAIFGVSREKEGLGRTILRHLRNGGYTGGIYPIHPEARELEGLPAYPDLSSVPGMVDLAVLALPSPALPAVVDDCGRKGVRGLVVVTGGFLEDGEVGLLRQKGVVARARGWGMRMIGPGTLGLTHLVPPIRLNASLVPGDLLPGPLAFASQSGALGVSVLQRARERGLGFGSFVSLGNKADISSNDLLQYWEDDPACRLVLLYLESFGNPRRFARLSRRVGRSKPIVALKSLRSPSALRAAVGHAPAPLAEDPTVDALFEQSGVLRVGRLEEALDLAELLVGQPLPLGPRVLVVTNATGPGVVAVDALLSEGLEVPELSPASQGTLRSLVRGAGSLRNPVDLGIFASGEDYARVIGWGTGSPEVDALMVVWIPLEAPDAAGTGEAIRAALGMAGPLDPSRGKTALWVTSWRGDPPPRSGRSPPVHCFPEPAARALGLAWRYARRRSTSPGVGPAFPEIPWEGLRLHMEEVRRRGGGELPPEETARFADLAGLRSEGTGPAPEGEPSLQVVVGGTDAFSPVLTLALSVPPLRLEIPRQRWILPITEEEGAEAVQRLEEEPLTRPWVARDPSALGRIRRTLLLLSRLVDEFPELEGLELLFPLGATEGVRLLRVWTTPAQAGTGIDATAPARTP